MDRRQVEINIAAIEYTEQADLHYAPIDAADNGFKAGAAWADAHPCEDAPTIKDATNELEQSKKINEVLKQLKNGINDEETRMTQPTWEALMFVIRYLEEQMTV